VVSLSLRVFGFAPRHLRRSPPAERQRGNFKLLDSFENLKLLPLLTARVKTGELRRQASCAIRRETESCATANVGVVKINLTVCKVLTLRVKARGGGEQVIGREAETATLFGTSSVKL